MRIGLTFVSDTILLISARSIPPIFLPVCGPSNSLNDTRFEQIFHLLSRKWQFILRNPLIITEVHASNVHKGTHGNMYHMGTPRGQPLEPCPLGAPVESLWWHCPSDPALWQLLHRAFGDTTPQAPPSRGSCQEPFRALPREPLVEGLNKSMYFLD